jgi:mono/diheme cytochrome c family protein
MRKMGILTAIGLIPVGFTALLLACRDEEPTSPPGLDAGAVTAAELDPALVREGKAIFRFDTFHDETFWTDTLKLHRVIRTSVSPATALKVGLKVDVQALPTSVRRALRRGEIDLEDPATTVTLLKLGAVVGLVGTVNEKGLLTKVGTTCAFCHSTVDNSFAPGIGRRLDGWPNRDLDVGAIIALSPAVTPEQRRVYRSWGPGMYDPRFNIDGKNLPVVIPPAFGLRRVEREIYTGDGPVTYWNEYVAVTQMHGHGRFQDSRIGVNVANPPDLVSPKLRPLRIYQFSLEKPEPPAGGYDQAAADRGRQVFRGAAGCVECHQGAVYTDVNSGILHRPGEVGQDPEYARRSATQRYRTTPLRGLWNPPQLTGPYFHDGSAGTLEEVVGHYVRRFDLSLTARQKSDLVEFLKSL